MRQIFAIIRKDVYVTFTDRSLLLIMFVTPLALAVIMGLAFGGLAGDQPTFADIPVALVNQDETVDLNGQPFNYGDIIADIMLGETDSAADSADEDATDLGTCDIDGAQTTAQQAAGELPFVTTQLDDPDAARAGVNDGTYAAAVVIPAGFSAALNPTVGTDEPVFGETTLEIYGDSGAPISASIVDSILTGITNQFVVGNVTVAATIEQLIDRTQTKPTFGLTFAVQSAIGGFQPDFACAFGTTLNTITIQQQPLNETQSASTFTQVLIGFGSAQALFFALFTANFGLLSIFEERDKGTLQRLIVAPISSSSILIGKVAGVMLTVLLQIAVLLLALTTFASLAEGAPTFIWGNPLIVILLVLITTLSMSSIGVLVVGIANTPDQARVIGPLLFAGLAALGGTFGFRLPESVAQFSPIYWGVDAFQKTASGSGDVLLNVMVLLVQGAVVFVIGLWLFNRRAEI